MRSFKFSGLDRSSISRIRLAVYSIFIQIEQPQFRLSGKLLILNLFEELFSLDDGNALWKRSHRMFHTYKTARYNKTKIEMNIIVRTRKNITKLFKSIEKREI